jgi:hypothetical protein
MRGAFSVVGIVCRDGGGAWLARIGRARRIAEVVSGMALVGLAVYFARLAQTLW